MSHWIIDDLGTICPHGSVAISQSLGVNAQRPGVVEYAIQNLGFIAVVVREKRLHVRCRPAVVSERAVGALSYLLLDNPNLPVTVSWFDQIWQLEHTPDARAALSFMSYVLELKTLVPALPGGRIRSRPSPRAASKWTEVRSTISTAWDATGSDDAFCARLDQTFHGRWSLFEVEAANGNIHTMKRGNGYPPLHPFFAGRQPVRGLESLADSEYRDWVHQTFVGVARSGCARFDDVDAIVYWPRFGDMRTRYWRMVVRLAANSDTCSVLSASGNDSGIDLRPKHIEEAGGIFGNVVSGHPQQNGLNH